MQKADRTLSLPPKFRFGSIAFFMTLPFARTSGSLTSCVGGGGCDSGTASAHVCI